MSLVLSITHNHVTKKVTVPRTNTVNQVSELALQKFNITTPNAVGELSHNNKVLDRSLPLRFTGLLSNSKLVLVVGRSSLSSAEVTVKLIVNYRSNETATFTGKVGGQLSLKEVLEEFGSKNEIRDVDSPSAMVVQNNSYTKEQYGTQLGAIVGNASSVVIRLNFLKDESSSQARNLEQEQIVRNQLEGQRKRNERLKEEERIREEERRKEEDRKDRETEGNEVAQPVAQPRETETDAQVAAEDVPAVSKSIPQNVPLQSDKMDIDTYTEPVEQETEGPQLYIPSSAPVVQHENPDEDYEITASKLQAYRKSIQDAAAPKRKIARPAKVPTKYNLRIKFPDRTILQINLLRDVETIKYGQLVKKIDDLLLDQYVGQYILKLGYPPFKKIEFSFNYNNQFLVSLPEFQSEKSVLIWEYVGPESNRNGPFIKTDSVGDVKHSNDLPEVVLESNRSSLPDEDTYDVIEKEDVERTTEKKDTPKSKVPKWFKR